MTSESYLIVKMLFML